MLTSVQRGQASLGTFVTAGEGISSNPKDDPNFNSLHRLSVHAKVHERWSY